MCRSIRPPDERIAFVLADAAPPVVITTGTVGWWTGRDGGVVDIDDPDIAKPARRCRRPGRTYRVSIWLTSGTTESPKGWRSATAQRDPTDASRPPGCPGPGVDAVPFRRRSTFRCGRSSVPAAWPAGGARGGRLRRRTSTPVGRRAGHGAHPDPVVGGDAPQGLESVALLSVTGEAVPAGVWWMGGGPGAR